MAVEVAVALFFIALGVWGYRRFERWRSRRRMAQMRVAGRQGEVRAERWLRANGFRIESDQARRSCTVSVNGQPMTFEVRADFLVQDPRGESAVVEVKTGASADPKSAATRRQIFEYAAIYGVKNVYLFDGTTDRLMHLEFVDQPSLVGLPRRRIWLPWGLAGFVAGVLAAALFS